MTNRHPSENYRDLNGLTRPFLMYSENPSEFVLINYKEILSLINYVCEKLKVTVADDARQQVFMRLLTRVKTDSDACSTKNLFSTIYFYISSYLESLNKRKEDPSGFTDRLCEDENFKLIDDSSDLECFDELIQGGELNHRAKRIFSLIRDGYTELKQLSAITCLSYCSVRKYRTKIKGYLKKYCKQCLPLCIISQ